MFYFTLGTSGTTLLFADIKIYNMEKLGQLALLNCIDDCESNRTLDDQLIYSGTYQAQNLVSSRNGIVVNPSSVTFRGNTILLDKNFTVDQGAIFLAEIAACQ